MKNSFLNYTNFGFPKGVGNITPVPGLRKISSRLSNGVGWMHSFHHFSLTELTAEMCNPFPSVSIAALTGAGARFIFDDTQTNGQSHYAFINVGDSSIPIFHLEKPSWLLPESWIVLAPTQTMEFDLSSSSKIIVLAIDGQCWRQNEIEIVSGAAYEAKLGSPNRFFFDAVCNLAKCHGQIPVDTGNTATMLMTALRMSKPYYACVYAGDGTTELYLNALGFINGLVRLPKIDAKLIGSVFGVTDKVINEVFFDANDSVEKAVIRAKMLKAKIYLLDPNNSRGSIQRIAEDVGIPNLSQFSQQFKKFHGYPPSKFFNSTHKSELIRFHRLGIERLIELLLTDPEIKRLALREKKIYCKDL